MADKKVTALTSLTSPASEDMLMIIDSPSGTPVSKQITLKNLAGGMPNTAISGTLSVSANTTVAGSNTVVSSNVTFTSTTRGPRTAARFITIAKSTGTVSNNATTELGGGMQGSILFDENYIYVATSNTVIKRVALSVFAS
jgi:hypothetical protein|tara:strand:+ start:174 stop:596 length:423 start_codon:yes stop_codon:yes gene_type:complete